MGKLFKRGTKDNIYNIAKINDNEKFREAPINENVPKHVDIPYKKINNRRILNKDSSFDLGIFCFVIDLLVYPILYLVPCP